MRAPARGVDLSARRAVRTASHGREPHDGAEHVEGAGVRAALGDQHLTEEDARVLPVVTALAVLNGKLGLGRRDLAASSRAIGRQA